MPQRQPSERLIVSIYVPTLDARSRRGRHRGRLPPILGKLPRLARADLTGAGPQSIHTPQAAGTWRRAMAVWRDPSDERLTSAADARDTALPKLGCPTVLDVLDVDASPSAGRSFAPVGCPVRSLASHRCTGEEVLLDDGVDAPVAIDHLGYAEVDSDRDERNRLVLGQSFGFHEERAHFAESVF